MTTAYVIKGKLIDRVTIKLSEPLPVSDEEVNVVIELLAEDKKKKRSAGLWKDKITLSPDFNEPLDMFQDYLK